MKLRCSAFLFAALAAVLVAACGGDDSSNTEGALTDGAPNADVVSDQQGDGKTAGDASHDGQAASDGSRADGTDGGSTRDAAVAAEATTNDAGNADSMSDAVDAPTGDANDAGSTSDANDATDASAATDSLLESGTDASEDAATSDAPDTGDSSNSDDESTCVPANCTTPPAGTCVGLVSTSYASPGTCDDGGCAYTPATSPCTDGCHAGACTGPFSAISNTVPMQGVNPIPLDTTVANGLSTSGGPASHTAGVTVTTTTSPAGTVDNVTLIWSLDPAMAVQNQNVVFMTVVSTTVDTWSGVIPAQAAGVEVYFFLDAHPYSGADGFEPTGFGIHHAYAVN